MFVIIGFKGIVENELYQSLLNKLRIYVWFIILIRLDYSATRRCKPVFKQHNLTIFGIGKLKSKCKVSKC